MRATCALLLGLTLFSSAASAGTSPPIQPVPYVNLPRFMGKWYLIAAVPTVYERNAWNAVETYTLQPDGNIHTTFRFNKGAADGPLKQIHSTGYVRHDSGGAVWGVKLFGPFKAQYIVAYLKPDYSLMIVARDARDYTWVFSRNPTISSTDWSGIEAKLTELGYDLAKLRKAPQRTRDSAASSR